MSLKPSQFARLRYLAAATVVVCSVGVALSVLLPQKMRMAGSENLRVDGIVAQIAPGDQVCRSDFNLLEGVGGIRLLSVGSEPPGSPLALIVDGPIGERKTVVRGGYSEQSFLTAAFPPYPRATTVRICVKNAGKRMVGLGGRLGDPPAVGKLTVEGKPVAGRLFVVPLEPPASLLGRAGAIFDRAAVWAPGWAGSWTFLLIFLSALVVVPLALWLVDAPSDLGRPGRERGRRWQVLARLPRAAIVIAMLAFFNGLCWSLIVPAWQGPDEISHFAYAQCLAETGRPQTDNGNKLLFSKEHQYAMESSFTDSVKGNTIARPPWSQDARSRWERLQSRTRASPSSGCGRAPTSGYSPLYYTLAAAGYIVTGGSIFDRAFGARLASVLLMALTVLFVWLFAAELFGRTGWPANTAALSVAFLPSFGFISGVVNNDAAVILLGTLELYLIARAMRRGATVRIAIAMGAVLALGYLAKPTLIAYAPLVLAVLAYPMLRRPRGEAARRFGAGLSAIAAVSLVWLVAAALWDHSAATVDLSKAQPFHPRLFAVYVWNFYLPNLWFMVDRFFPTQLPLYSVWIHQFWASFGWHDTLFPEWVYRTISVISTVGASAIVVAALRYRARLRQIWPIVLASLSAVVLLALIAHYASYRFFPGYPLEQGRYLFPAVAVFGAAAAAAAAAAGRWSRVIASVIVVALACFTFFSYGLTLLRYYG